MQLGMDGIYNFIFGQARQDLAQGIVAHILAERTPVSPHNVQPLELDSLRSTWHGCYMHTDNLTWLYRLRRRTIGNSVNCISMGLHKQLSRMLASALTWLHECQAAPNALLIGKWPINQAMNKIMSRAQADMHHHIKACSAFAARTSVPHHPMDWAAHLRPCCACCPEK